ncbi:MAG: CsgG/HfaB family protein [Elusimicrobiales bacterium]|nr:CsgG/HfaB family protein [Elusimicrobiales bacterium]
MKNFILALALLLSACTAPKVAVNPRADFSGIKRVAVLSFSGPKGDLAADVMTQSLLERGADVVERQRLDSVLREQSLTASSAFDPATAKQLGRLLGVDALFVGTVAESTPQSTYIVSQSANPQSNVTQVSGNTVYSEGAVMGLPTAQLLSTTANVSLLSRMVDVQTGSVMWSASMAYEGFDITSAMSSITDAFIRSLSPIWPELSAK